MDNIKIEITLDRNAALWEHVREALLQAKANCGHTDTSSYDEDIAALDAGELTRAMVREMVAQRLGCTVCMDGVFSFD